MGRVVVDAPRIASRDLLEIVGNAIETSDRPDGAEIRVRLDEAAPKRSDTPSAAYDGAVVARIKSGRWSSLTPADVVAWWAGKYRSFFGHEDAALTRHGAAAAAGRAVGRSKRRDHRGDAESLLRFLTAVLRWWALRRRRGARFPSGLPSLAGVLDGDYFLKLWVSGDMDREIVADEANAPRQADDEHE